jgi:murein DD-endopeptidase MepM/ murein hydrolase activator NlpD
MQQYRIGEIRIGTLVELEGWAQGVKQISADAKNLSQGIKTELSNSYSAAVKVAVEAEAKVRAEKLTTSKLNESLLTADMQAIKARRAAEAELARTLKQFSDGELARTREQARVDAHHAQEKADRTKAQRLLNAVMAEEQKRADAELAAAQANHDKAAIARGKEVQKQRKQQVKEELQGIKEQAAAQKELDAKQAAIEAEAKKRREAALNDEMAGFKKRRAMLGEISRELKALSDEELRSVARNSAARGKAAQDDMERQRERMTGLAAIAELEKRTIAENAARAKQAAKDVAAWERQSAKEVAADNARFKEQARAADKFAQQVKKDDLAELKRLKKEQAAADKAQAQEQAAAAKAQAQAMAQAQRNAAQLGGNALSLGGGIVGGVKNAVLAPLMGIGKIGGVIGREFLQTFRYAVGNAIGNFISDGFRKGFEMATGSIPGQLLSVFTPQDDSNSVKKAVDAGFRELQAATTLRQIAQASGKPLAATEAESQAAAEGFIQNVNRRLSLEAQDLPGSTQQYKQLSQVVSDSVVKGFQGPNGVDLKGFEDSLVTITKSFAAAGADSEPFQTQVALTGLLEGRSGSELARLKFFQDNPAVGTFMQQQLSSAGVESTKDLTDEGRVRLVENIAKILQDAQSLKDIRQDPLAIRQGFTEQLFDLETGILGKRRNLEVGADGKAVEGTSLMDTFGDLTKTLYSLQKTNAEGKTTGERGFFQALAEGSQAGGLNFKNPLEIQRDLLISINEWAKKATVGMDEFFASERGQALVDTLNGIQERVAAVGKGFAGAIGGLFSGEEASLENPLGALLDITMRTVGAVKATLGGIWDGIMEGYRRNEEALNQAFEILFGQGVDNALGLYVGLGEVIGNIAAKTLDWLAAFTTSGGLQTTVTAIKVGFDSILAVLSLVVENADTLLQVTAAIGVAWASIKTAGFLTALPGMFSAAATAATGIVAVLGGPLTLAVAGVLATLALVVARWGEIKGGAIAAWDAVKLLVGTTAEVITNLGKMVLGTDLWVPALQKGWDVAKGIVGGLGEAVQGIAKSEAGQLAWNFSLMGAWEWMTKINDVGYSIGGKIGEAITGSDLWKKSLNGVLDFFTSIHTAMTNLFEGFLEKLGLTQEKLDAIKMAFGFQGSVAANGASEGSLDQSQLDSLFAGGSNSLIAKVIGMAEGNRDKRGGYTEHAKGHRDPGNGAWNVGSFSAQGNLNKGSIAASDAAVIDQLLKPAVSKLFDEAAKVGVAITPKVLFNYLDLMNQAPQAATGDAGGPGFLGQLSKLKMNENNDKAIAQLRVDSFRNNSGALETSFGSEGELLRDQQRRMGELNDAIKAFKKEIPQGSFSSNGGGWSGTGGPMGPNFRGGSYDKIATGTLAAQEYGASRGGGTRKHAGQDLDLGDADSFKSYIGGVVTQMGNDDSGYFKWADIYNKTLGVVERVAELDSLNLSVGQRVAPGEVVGSGTQTTGVVHYEIRTPDAQGKGGFGYQGTRDPIEYLEGLGLVKRQGNQLVPTGAGMNNVSVAEHHEGDGHDHGAEKPKVAIKAQDEALLNELRNLLLNKHTRNVLGEGAISEGQGIAKRMTTLAESAGNLGQAGRNEIGAYLKKIADQNKAFAPNLAGANSALAAATSGRGGAGTAGSGAAGAAGLTDISKMQDVAQMAANARKLADAELAQQSERDKQKRDSEKQARKVEHDTAIANLEKAASAMDPNNTLGRQAISQQQAQLQQQFASGEELASVRDQLAVLRQSQSSKQGKVAEYQARKAAYEQDIAYKGRSDNDTEQSLEELRLSLPATDYARSIKELEAYEKALVGIQATQAETLKNNQQNEVNAQLEEAEKSLARQRQSLMGITSEGAQFVAQLKLSAMGREEETHKLKEQIESYETILKSGTLTADQQERYNALLTEAKGLLEAMPTVQTKESQRQIEDYIAQQTQAVASITTGALGNAGPRGVLENQVSGVFLAQTEQERSLDKTIESLKEVQRYEGLSEEQQARLLALINEATSARQKLAENAEREAAALAQAYEMEQRAAAMDLRDTLASPVLDSFGKMADKAESGGDKFRANEIRQAIALKQREFELGRQMLENERLRNEELARYRKALSDGNTEMYTKMGINSEQDLEGRFNQRGEQLQIGAELDMAAIEDQFVSITENFEKSVTASLQSGLKNGFMTMVNGEGSFWENLRDGFMSLFNGIFQTVMDLGAENLSSALTATLSGKKEGGLGDLFGRLTGGRKDEDKAMTELEMTLQGAEATETAIVSGFQQGVAMLQQATAGMVPGGGQGAGQIQYGAAYSGAGATIVSPGLGLNGTWDSPFTQFGSLDAGGLLKSAPSMIPTLGPGATPTFTGEGAAIGQEFLEATEGFGRDQGGMFGATFGQGFGSMLSQLGGAMGGKGGAGGIFGQLLGMVGPLLSMFGGKGGGGVAGNIGESIGGLFYAGGAVGNYALGGSPIMDAYRREKAMSGRTPKLVFLNDGEFVMRAPAVDAIGTGRLAYMNKEGAIPNFASGGLMGQASTLGSPGIDSSQGTVSSAARNVNIEMKYSKLGDLDIVSKADLDMAIGNVNSRIPDNGRIISTTAQALRSSMQLRRSIGMGMR